MEAVESDPTFSNSDVNLKFNKPEIYVTIDREKHKSLGFCFDVAQTLRFIKYSDLIFPDERKTISGYRAIR